MDGIWLIFVGASLQLLASLLVESFRTRRTSNSDLKTLFVNLRLNFKSVLKYLEEIERVRHDKGYYAYRSLNLLDKTIESLQTEQHKVAIIKNSDVQESVIDLIQQLSLLSSDLRTTQGVFDEQTNLLNGKKVKEDVSPIFDSLEALEKVDNQTRTQHSLSIIELKRKVEELIKLLQSGK